MSESARIMPQLFFANFLAFLGQLCPNYAPTLPQLILQYFIEFLGQPCPNYAPTMSRLCPNYAQRDYAPTMPQLCLLPKLCPNYAPSFAPTMPQLCFGRLPICRGFPYNNNINRYSLKLVLDLLTVNRPYVMQMPTVKLN